MELEPGKTETGGAKSQKISISALNILSEM